MSRNIATQCFRITARASRAAEGILLVAERYDDSQPVNLGSSYEISIKELLETIAEYAAEEAGDFGGIVIGGGGVHGGVRGDY